MRLIHWILIFPILLGVIDASEVLVNTQDGQTFVFDADPNESLGVLQDRLSAITDGEAYIVALPSNQKKWKALRGTNAGAQGQYLGHPRDYALQVQSPERNDIHFIVSSLADKTLITLAFLKGDLEAAGDRIDHIHPLRFLMTIFTDEEMKVGIRNIRGRGWVWGQFSSGMKECLATEANIGNMKDEYVLHFAKTVEVHPNKILPLVRSSNWDAFIEVLIKEVPRKGDHDRYDN